MAASRGSSVTATMAGFAAILLWGSLAILTAMASAIPVFQLTAMAFAIATLVGVAYGLFSTPGLGALTRVPLAACMPLRFGPV